MKITKVSAIPMSAPVPEDRRHRTDTGTKIKTDATLIRVETDSGATGIGAALGTPPVVAAIVHHEIAPECLGEDPMFSERIFEKMYNASRAGPALARGVAQPDPSRRRGMVMEAIAGVDIALWDVKAQALGAARSSVRGYASGGWAPGDEAAAELGGYAAKGFTAVKMRVVGRDGFSIANCVRRVKAARRGIGPDVELMVDAHGSLEVPVAIKACRSVCGSPSRGDRLQRLSWLDLRQQQRGPLAECEQDGDDQPGDGRRRDADKDRPERGPDDQSRGEHGTEPANCRAAHARREALCPVGVAGP